MKLLKDLATFAACEFGVKLLVCSMLFSLWTTSGLIRAYEAAGYMKGLLFALTSTCVILNVMMVVVAVKLIYDSFQDFRANRTAQTD